MKKIYTYLGLAVAFVGVILMILVWIMVILDYLGMMAQLK